MRILVLARFIQGLGAGAIPPIAYVAIGRSLPEALRPRMFATLSTAWVLPGRHRSGAGRSHRRVHRLARACSSACSRSSSSPGCSPSARCVAVPAAEASAAAEAAAGAAERRRLPNALLVAAGAGLITVGHDDRRARSRPSGS